MGSNFLWTIAMFLGFLAVTYFFGILFGIVFLLMMLISIALNIDSSAAMATRNQILIIKAMEILERKIEQSKGGN